MKPKNCLNQFSAAIVGGFERFFYWYGKLVATHRWKFLLGCLVGTGLCAIGLLNLTAENNPYNLWVPDDSDSVANNKWITENYPTDSRYNNFIVTGDNILKPEVLKEMLRMHNEVANNVTLGDGSKWENQCKRLPILDIDLPASLEASRISDCSDPTSPSYDPSICLESEIYCPIVNQTIVEVCFERSILELWGYNATIYDDLTKADILAKLNEPDVASVIFKTAFPLDTYLSYTRDATSNEIIAATGASITWMGQIDTEYLSDPESFAGVGFPVDPNTEEFEGLLLDVMFTYQTSFASVASGIECYANVASAFEDLAAESIIGDALFVPLGFFFVFIYVMIVLGNYHWVETRAMLALSGCTSIALTIFVCYGLCSAMGLIYSPMHNSIPFILLGIGIDDMFVIIQCYDNLSQKELDWGNHPKNIALAMKHAGSAITVTSLTDFIVFSIGATSSLPALSSFCLYCAVGIVAVFFFQATFFIACLSFDLERVEHGRNGCILCYKHKDYVYEYKSTAGISQKLFKFVGETILKLPAKICLILVTLTLLGFGIWGTVSLEVKFESIWFLPADSHLRLWYEADEAYYPSEGESGLMYITDIDYPNELYKIEDLIGNMTAAEGNIKVVNSWFPDYKDYVNNHIGVGDDGMGIPEEILPLDDFSQYTSQFLFSPTGSRWQPSFFPEDDILSCGSPIAPLALTTYSYIHERFDSTSEHINALNDLKYIIDDQDFSANVFPVSLEYANWETDEVIKKELYRNLGLSFLCIFITTLILLADITASIMVMVCVGMVLVDVLGFMHFWGLTIDVVSSINVIISIGLCVDYSAHVAHMFLHQRGTRQKRAAQTLYDIGPAVLNGGFSTFIATITLCASDSHVFVSFFRIFFLVVIFGLFHGLIFLPIMFSLIGPRTYEFKRHEDEIEEIIEAKEDQGHDGPTIEVKELDSSSIKY